MPFVVGIDVGLTNQGLCLLDPAQPSRPVLERSRVLPARAAYKEGETFGHVRDWVNARWEKVFSRAECVYIERQMMGEGSPGPWARKFLVIENQLLGYLVGKGVRVVMVSPRDVRRWSGCSKGSHKANKRASVEYAKKIVEPGILRDFKRKFGGKIDDVCDAFQTALYGLSRA